MAKPVLNIGLIGSGFMGKAHAFGYGAARQVFDLPYDVVLHTLADASDEIAGRAATALGFAKGTGDWRAMVADLEIDVVSVTTPNALHFEMSMAAIAAGKHVYCEKPLAPTVAEAEEMAKAAKGAGVRTQLGFNYLMNPMLRLARVMIEAGEIGEVYGFRGLHAEDFMADGNAPFAFRHEPAGGGALNDIGSHALATAEYLMGPIAKVMGDCVTVIAERPHNGGHRRVEADDVARAFLRFESGLSGSIEANWLATGRKMQHDFEVYGSKGALCFSQERFNELHFYSAEDAAGRRGFRRIEAAPDHAPYGRFCPAPGHQIGFNDLKAIEVAGFIEAIAAGGPDAFGFDGGLRIQRIIEAIHTSAAEERWVNIG